MALAKRSISCSPRKGCLAWHPPCLPKVCLSGRHRSLVPTVLRGMNKQLEQCLTEAVFELVQGSPQLPA